MIETGVIDVILFSINPAFDLLPAQTDIDDYFKDETYNAETRFSIDPERAALYRLCEEKGVGITVMKALGAGRLLNAETSSFGMALTPAQCIQYALDRPAVSSVLLGQKPLRKCSGIWPLKMLRRKRKTILAWARAQNRPFAASVCIAITVCPVPPGSTSRQSTSFTILPRSRKVCRIPFARTIRRWKTCG